VKSYVHAKVKRQLSLFSVAQYQSLVNKHYDDGPLQKIEIKELYTHGVLHLSILDPGCVASLFGEEKMDVAVKVTNAILAINEVK
jgi:hypothetical protein